MELKSAAKILNGFVHDFASGIWLAAIVTIVLLHRAHSGHAEIVQQLNGIEHLFFRGSLGAMLVIIATGAGRTFTYVENWYGPDAEAARRRMLLIKHLVLAVCFGGGYLLVWKMIFH